jgi:hypothetical protein
MSKDKLDGIVSRRVKNNTVARKERDVPQGAVGSKIWQNLRGFLTMYWSSMKATFPRFSAS